MAIKIQTEEPVIPIEIGELRFEFKLTDDNIQRLYDAHDDVKKEFENIKQDDLETAKNTVKKALDYILGEGAFDKIYKISPSIIIVVKYFWQITEGLEGEILKKAGKTAQKKVEKYLRQR